jgi:hypothetical protein
VTTRRGDIFERKVFDVVKANLENGEFGLDPKLVKLHSKKGYWSKVRESDIVTDISMELWLPNSNKYSLLIVFECKDYDHSIPVDDIEEFKAKLDQIAGKNVKGIFVTSNVLQKSALKYAASNEIGVIRIIPDESIRWIYYQRVALGYVVIPPDDMSIDDYKYSLFIESLNDEEIEPYDYEEDSEFEGDDEDIDPYELHCALTMGDFCIESKEVVGFCNKRIFGDLSDLIRVACAIPNERD